MKPSWFQGANFDVSKKQIYMPGDFGSLAIFVECYIMFCIISMIMPAYLENLALSVLFGLPTVCIKSLGTFALKNQELQS
jgi:hypothetical protein